MKKIKIFLIIILIIEVSFALYKNNQKTTNKGSIPKTVSKESITKKILNKIDDENITEEFLNWISSEYGKKTLTNLDKELSKEKYNSTIWHKITGTSYIVLNDLYNKQYEKMDNVKIIDKKETSTISFIGDVSLADNWYIMPKYDERKKGIYGILSEQTVDIMKKSDIMIANSEFTVSDRGEKMPGKYYTFRASPQRLKIYEEMGVDLVTLANNHVYDFGKTAFYDMIDSLNEYKIPYIGAGKNIEEEKKPYYFIINGYKFAFVNATRAEKYIMTPEAKENTPGVFRCYDPTNLINFKE